MKKVIVVGSGAGGATAAKELQGTADVTILEAGKAFRPFAMSVPDMERWKKTGLLFDERAIQLIFPTMKIRKTADGMILVNGIGVGGTTPISTGNAVRMDDDLRALGINLDAEFEEIAREIPISTAHQKSWHKTTRRLFHICHEMGLDPLPTPKMGSYDRCTHCGRCVFGCPWGVKWDSRQFVERAIEKGARLVTQCRVETVVIHDGRAVGVQARQGRRRQFYPADLVILAAGGFGTPVILQRSGIPCEPTLFVDPVLCVATEWPKAYQCTEVEMPFIVQRDHFMISPYFDYLSFIFNRKWNYPARNIVGLMIKLADCNGGNISTKKVDKTLTALDKERLNEAVELCRAILGHFGAKDENLFLGTINAGHPGGMMPLTASEADSFHHDRLPENLYIADATLLPRARGNPPILTIVAIAKRVSRLCARQLQAGERRARPQTDDR